MLKKVRVDGGEPIPVTYGQLENGVAWSGRDESSSERKQPSGDWPAYPRTAELMPLTAPITRDEYSRLAGGARRR